MVEITGQWTGTFSGALTGSLTLELNCIDQTLSGRGKFEDASFGVPEFNIEGRGPGQGNEVNLILTPALAAPQPELGKIEVRGRLGASGDLSGEWISSLGPRGVFFLSRSTSYDSSKPSVFIVHGHDEASKEKVARVIEKLGLHPIILHEKTSRSMTVVEKFEKYANQSSFAIALFTPDDIGYCVAWPEKKASRARQNVILELGYFFGKLGRGKVVVLCKGDLEMPTDIGGLAYIPLDDAGGWQSKLVRELRVAGIAADANRLGDV